VDGRARGDAGSRVPGTGLDRSRAGVWERDSAAGCEKHTSIPRSRQAGRQSQESTRSDCESTESKVVRSTGLSR
jgi:hypothetical protein